MVMLDCNGFNCFSKLGNCSFLPEKTHLKKPNLVPLFNIFSIVQNPILRSKGGVEWPGVVRSSQETTVYGENLLRKPVVSSPAALDGEESVKECLGGDGSEPKGGDGGTWVDWEDQILGDTVPLVGFVRMILHSGEYESGDRLSPEHERTILERLLPYHPQCETKIGGGVDYITVPPSFPPTFSVSFSGHDSSVAFIVLYISKGPLSVFSQFLTFRREALGVEKLQISLDQLEVFLV
ncbi:UNVERIFIED_CONTAM: protein DCL, chloroplastic [Sesamum calycinum]|uniref:Protein DCL, chloroplastic n=1 Tax=Sesamum calycinum TaxID=2727403 RepID=A0AAW2P935_9LAMI